MKATVFTRWNTQMGSPEEGRPKCIFKGEIQSIPHIGESIVVREGFCCEKVIDVYHDFVANSVEIHVDTKDLNNEYGPSLTNVSPSETS